MLSNQGRRYAFSLKIENFNFSLKSDNNETSPRKRPRPPSYLKRQKLRASLQKEQQKKLSVKDVLEKNSDKDTKNEENRHFQWTPAPVNPTHSEQEREQKDNTEDNNKKMKRTITLRKYSKQLSNLHLLNQKETHMSLQSRYAKEKIERMLRPQD